MSMSEVNKQSDPLSQSNLHAQSGMAQLQQSTQAEVQLKNTEIDQEISYLHPQKHCHHFLFALLLFCSICAFCIVGVFLIQADLARISQTKVVKPIRNQSNSLIPKQFQSTRPLKPNIIPNQTEETAQKDINQSSNSLSQVNDQEQPRFQLHKSSSAFEKFDLQSSPAYFEIQQVGEFSQLPFCLIVWAADQEFTTKIVKSIKKQKYSNKKILFFDKNYTTDSRESGRNFASSNYYYTYQLLVTQCVQNSLILFLHAPLRSGALQYLSTIFNRYNTWLVYQRTQKSVRVISFYLRVFQLVGKNDFTGRAVPHLKNNSMEIQVYAMMKLCSSHSKKIQMSQIFLNEQQDPHFSAPVASVKFSKLYQVNERLSQDFENEIIFDPKWKKVALKKDPLPGLGLNKKHMLRSIQFQQMWYLPKNHSLAKLENLYYNKLYGIEKYRQIQKQVPLCVTILNYNNVQNDRYRKLFISVLGQEYQNYRLVVIDDFSSDGSLEKIKQFMQQKGFQPERILYVANSQRLYATYNIMNAVYNFCKEGEIQLLLDGDDELIGRQAFSVINSAYQSEDQVWAVYSNYKSNLYHFGRSRALMSESEYQEGGRRKFVSYIGPIRTWKVELMYHLPLSYQMMENGKWLDTAYDDNIQYCLLELGTPARVRYIPEILYEYNRKYGNNDDSTPAKLLHRNQTYEKYILRRQPLEPLLTLVGSIRLDDMAQIFELDRNIKYRII